MAQERDIVFAYRKSQMKYGSTVMRTHQLCTQIAPHLPPGWRARPSGMPSPKFPLLQVLWARVQPEGAFVLINKQAIRKVLPETLAALRKRRCRVGFDYVDSDLREAGLSGADVHIAASPAARRTMERIRHQAQESGRSVSGIVRLLHHNVDTQLFERPAVPKDHLRCVYFGSPVKTDIPPSLAGQVRVLDATDARLARSAWQQIAQFNFHYCISSPPAAWQADAAEIVHRPFTKGFTAAALGAGLITNTTVDDAAELLGSDYPYLVPGHDHAAIIATLERASAGFGGSEWNDAQARVAAMTRLFMPEALAKALVEIVREVGD